MTGYSSEENNGWEFKIVRASTPRFKRAEVVRRLAEEEAEAGWELLEKFDDNRIRFKRRIEHRADDAHRAIDPYRTRYGVSSDRRGLAIAVGIMLVVAALAAFFIFKAAS